VPLVQAKLYYLGQYLKPQDRVNQPRGRDRGDQPYSQPQISNGHGTLWNQYNAFFKTQCSDPALPPPRGGNPQPSFYRPNHGHQGFQSVGRLSVTKDDKTKYAQRPQRNPPPPPDDAGGGKPRPVGRLPLNKVEETKYAQRPQQNPGGGSGSAGREIQHPTFTKHPIDWLHRKFNAAANIEGRE